MFFYVLMTLLILQRIGELRLAKKNYQWVIAHGGIELGREHYGWMWALHTFFFGALFLEYILLQPSIPEWALLPLFAFTLAQGLRIWAIVSLGPYWNTRIVIILGATLEPKGPYRYIRHPNYLAVIIEIASIPLLFGLYITATIFTLLNALMLTHRIRIEEEALLQHTSYVKNMQNIPRMIPRRKRQKSI